jgi:MFS family permease
VPRQGLVAGLGLAAMGLGLAGVAAAPTLEAAGVVLFLTGLVRSACTVGYVTIVQTRAPPSLRGRVLALFMLGVQGLAPLSVGLGGLAADLAGPRGVFLAGGAVVTLAGAYALSRRAFREAT